MKPSQAIMRRRAAEAIILIVLVVSAPFVVDFFVPSMSRFVPPSMLSLLLLLSILNALLVWRTQWLFSKLFSIENISVEHVFSQQVRRNAEIGAIVGIVTSVIMVVIWLRTFL